MKAGWLKILRNEKKLPTTRNVNSVCRVRMGLLALAQLNSTSQVRSENTSHHLKIDKQAVQDQDSCITEIDCNPFDLEKPQLRSLEYRVIASDELVCDFESAH